MNDAKSSFDAPIPVTVLKEAKHAPLSSVDHSNEILQKLDRDAGDRITCVHVFDDFYRCNWWSPGSELDDARMLYGTVAATYRVRKSRFVRATLSNGQLVIADATRVPLD